MKKKKSKKPKPYGCVYLIVCCLNDMEYVGQTTRTVKARFDEHCRHHKAHIDKAINCYGRENFLIITLKECYSQAELDKWERRIIFAKGTKEPFGYNVADGGKFSDLSGANNPAYGKPAWNRGYSPYKNLLAELEARGIFTYIEFAIVMNSSLPSIRLKMRGKRKFSKKDHAKLVKIFDKPIEYLLEREDGEDVLSMPKRNSGANNPAYGKPAWNRGYSPYKNLLTELEARGIVTYRQIAELLSVSINTIKHKIHGDRNFTNEEKAFLVDYLGKPAEYLFARDNGIDVFQDNKKPSPMRKNLYKNLLTELEKRGIITYADFATLMNLSLSSIEVKMSGKAPFTNKQKAFLSDYIKKPVEYLFARTDGKSDKPSSRFKSPYKNLLTELEKRGIVTKVDIATLMCLSYSAVKFKMSGERAFTDKQKAFLADYLKKPVEYLFQKFPA